MAVADNIRVLRGMRPARKQPAARPAARAPRAPNHLAGEALKEWRRVAPLLVERGQINELDRTLLSMYAQSWAIVVACEKELASAMQAAAVAGSATDALVEISSRSGLPRRSMLAQLAAQHRRECLQHLTALALSPTARARLPAPSGQLELPGLDGGSAFDDL